MKLINAWFILFSVISSSLAEIGQKAYTEDELGKPLTYLKNKHGHGFISVHGEHLVTIYSRDGGGGDGGIAFWDFSNPAEPEMISDTYNDDTDHIREAHGWGMSGNLACLQAHNGIQIWDWSDHMNPERLSYLNFPGISKGDYSGCWWTCWQGDYVYAGGSDNGLYIARVQDPSNPEFIKKLSKDQTGGFRVGPVFAIGNLLVISSMDKEGYSTLDISDPENPVLLDTKKGTSPYSSMVNGNLLFGFEDQVEIYDISDPLNIKLLGETVRKKNKGGYGMVHDNFLMGGFSKKGLGKFDLTKEGWPLIQEGRGKGDEDFASAVGNVAIMGNDHSGGSAILPHAKEIDTKGPLVNMIIPKSGSKHQALTSRVGITLTDNILPNSVLPENFIVRPQGGDPLEGSYGVQTGIVNFSPKDKLQENTVYEIIIRKGGLMDLVGNPTEEEFVSSFSTGEKEPTVSTHRFYKQKDFQKNYLFNFSETGHVLFSPNQTKGLHIGKDVTGRVRLRLR